MGYHTEFSGSVEVEPPLNEHEIAYLADFCGSRRMDREQGPYYAVPGTNSGQGGEGVRNYNGPPAGQPGLWCQWVADDSGTTIEWDGNEKFYDSVEWMQYIIDHFFRPGAEASKDLAASVKQDPRFAHFTFDHVVNGEIYADGEESGDIWKLVVVNNEVTAKQGQITYD